MVREYQGCCSGASFDPAYVFPRDVTGCWFGGERHMAESATALRDPDGSRRGGGDVQAGGPSLAPRVDGSPAGPIARPELIHRGYIRVGAPLVRHVDRQRLAGIHFGPVG